MSVKRLFLLSITLFASVLFSSCSPAKVYYQPHTQSPRQPWKGSSGKWGGYQESKLAGSMVREIRYTGYNKPGLDAAEYFCLVRAAECALLDGKEAFWVSGVRKNIEIETSNFPEQVIDGYWEMVPYRHYYRGAHGEKCYDVHYRNEYTPPEYYPPYAAVNQIQTAKLQMSYRPGKGKHYLSREVLQAALDDKAGYGKPKLDKRVMALLSAKSGS